MHGCENECNARLIDELPGGDKMRTQGESGLLLTPLPTTGNLPWGGIGIQSFFVASGFQPKPSCPSMVLFLHLKGSPKVSWRSGRQQFHRNWKYGDYTFIGRDLELRDVHVDGDHAGLAIDITSQDVDVWMRNFPSSGYPPFGSLPPHLYGEDPHLLHMALSIRDEIHRGCPCGRIFAESISLALLSHFYGNHGHAQAHTRRRSRGLAPATMKLVEDYIRANLGNDISLADLAALAHVSLGQFCRIFSMATGMPPHRYVMHARIDKAKTILRSSCKSVTDVALELGFASPSHFSFTFRKLTGTSPREFLQLP